MDLLDYCDGHLCFDDPVPAEAQRLLREAAGSYSAGEAEILLLRAALRTPEHLGVLVELYRHYLDRRQLSEALVVAERAVHIASRRLGLPPDWQSLDERCLATAAAGSFRLLRFYLLALKSVSILLLRLGRVDASRLRLERLAQLDHAGRLGAARLLEAIDAFQPNRLAMN